MIADQKGALYSTNMPLEEVENTTNALNALRYSDSTVMWTDKYHSRAYPSFFIPVCSAVICRRKSEVTVENVILLHRMLGVERIKNRVGYIIMIEKLGETFKCELKTRKKK